MVKLSQSNPLIFTKATKEIDGTGKTLTTGLFNGETHIGAVEVGAIDSTVDYQHKQWLYNSLI